jgi:hypothetical protein
VHLTESDGRWHDLRNGIPLPFLAEFDSALIRWRQVSGPANGSAQPVGVYLICYERTNVITNQRDTCCFTVTVRCNTPLVSEELITTTLAPQSKVMKDMVYNFKLMASPNPAPHNFTLKVASDDNKGRVSMKVMDIAGRVVEARDGLTPNQTVQIGSKYRPGVYIVQVMQGTRTAVMKLIKQSD